MVNNRAFTLVEVLAVLWVGFMLGLFLGAYAYSKVECIKVVL